jgi:hypothetical protein
MIRCDFYEDGRYFKTDEMMGVPRVGEAVVMGYGSEYRVVRVTDVTWPTDLPDGRQKMVNLSVIPEKK